MGVCPNCEGFGYKEEGPKLDPRLIPCPTCKTTKEVEPPWDTAKVCPDCQGTGFIRDLSFKAGQIVGRVRCKRCEGKGVVLA